MVEDEEWYEYILKMYYGDKLEHRLNSLIANYSKEQDVKLEKESAEQVVSSVKRLLDNSSNPEKWFKLHGA